MLEIDLHALEQRPKEWRVEVPEEGGPWEDTDLRFAEPPVLDLVASLTGDRGVHVRGVLEATLLLRCRRCLRDIRHGMELSLDLLFDPGVDKEGENEQVYPLEAKASVLDLAPAVREQLLLEVPPYPLCAEDCAGLCPSCGIDRNEEECDCTLEEPDPRWDALRELKQTD
jgi:uncharacterized protein